MKKMLKTILIFVFLLCGAFPVFSVTDHQLKNFFSNQERSFYKSYTLDYYEITFHCDKEQQRYEWMDHDEAGSFEVASGDFYFKDGIIYLEREGKDQLKAIIEGLDNDVPYIDYYAKLTIIMEPNKDKNLEFISSSPEAGETVYYQDVELKKQNFYFVVDKVYTTYTKPDENSDLYISHRIYQNKYKDEYTFRLIPGVPILVVGKYGNWLLLKDEFRHLYKKDYCWIKVDNPQSIKSFNDYSNYSQIDVVPQYQNLFYENLYYLTPLSSREINAIDDRKGYVRYYDYSCVLPEDFKIIEKTFTPVNDAGKNMYVAENLKLRDSADTSTEVIAIMGAGTKVEIIEIGKKDVIDRICSNWVKVKVQFGAKDRDGKSIKVGTVGWCYGGYLE